MASVGLTQEEMAAVLEMAVETLVKHYAMELATAAATAIEAVGRASGSSRWRFAERLDEGSSLRRHLVVEESNALGELPFEHRLSRAKGGPIQSEAIGAREFIETGIVRLAARAQDGDDQGH